MSDLQAHLERQFHYDDWANREVLGSLQRLAEPPPRAIRLLAHLIGAQYVWLDRLHSRPPSIEVWPRMQLEQMPQHLQLLREWWAGYLQSADLGTAVRYQNSKGEQFSSTARDIVTHVVNHGTYHRGQIAILMRDSGADPAYTDWIHAARQGHI